MNNVEHPVHIIICDDQAIVCEGLRAIFATTEEIVVDAIANNGIEAVEAVEKFHPALVLMDLKMPEMDGVEATRLICEKYPETRILILTTYDTEDWVINAVRSGASGYILKDTPREDLLQTIFDTVSGRHHIDPKVAGKLLSFVANPQAAPSFQEQKLISTLNEREREIIRCLGRGYTNAEIAQTLFLTEGTVKNYVSVILSKLGVSDRTQAAIIAVKNMIN